MHTVPRCRAMCARRALNLVTWAHAISQCAGRRGGAGRSRSRQERTTQLYMHDHFVMRAYNHKRGSSIRRQMTYQRLVSLQYNSWAGSYICPTAHIASMSRSINNPIPSHLTNSSTLSYTTTAPARSPPPSPLRQVHSARTHPVRRTSAAAPVPRATRETASSAATWTSARWPGRATAGCSARTSTEDSGAGRVRPATPAAPGCRWVTGHRSQVACLAVGAHKLQVTGRKLQYTQVTG